MLQTLPLARGCESVGLPAGLRRSHPRRRRCARAPHKEGRNVVLSLYHSFMIIFFTEREAAEAVLQGLSGTLAHYGPRPALRASARRSAPSSPSLPLAVALILFPPSSSSLPLSPSLPFSPSPWLYSRRRVPPSSKKPSPEQPSLRLPPVSLSVPSSPRRRAFACSFSAPFPSLSTCFAHSHTVCRMRSSHGARLGCTHS